MTEKETLCQLLQEKDQLQREQADRIRNLTKLLVTSNVVQVQKVIENHSSQWPNSVSYLYQSHFGLYASEGSQEKGNMGREAP